MQVEQEDNVETTFATKNVPGGGQVSPPQNKPRQRWVIALVAFLIVAAVVISGIVPRVR
jgi:hypothetical protein